jgi:hypothetical protein
MKFCGFSHGKTCRNPFVMPPQPPASALGCPLPQFKVLEETPPSQSNDPPSSFASDVNMVLLSMPARANPVGIQYAKQKYGGLYA